MIIVCMIKVLFSALAGVALFASAATSQAGENWSMATSWGGGPFLKKDAEGFANYVEKLTAGRIKIQVFPGGTLGKALKVSDTVKSNVAQIGHTWMGYDWGIDKTTVIFANMAGGLNPEELIIWLYEVRSKSIQQWFKVFRIRLPPIHTRLIDWFSYLFGACCSN